MDKKKSSKHKRPKGESGIWKEKYDSLDEKYTRMKDILKQVLHGMKEETEKLQLVKKENSNLKEKLSEKENILERMQSVSEAVVEEYSILKAKYEMESEAATAAAKRATKYLQQNIILKRKSAVPPQNSVDLFQVDVSECLADDDGIEEMNQNAEIELLSRTTSDLRNEVANLKIQLEKEIGIQVCLKEDIEIAKNLFEEEMLGHSETKAKLKLAEKSLEQLKRVSELYVVKEFGELQSRYEEESDKVKRISLEIAAVQKENTALSEQHSVLLSNSSPSDQLSAALKKIEELMATINDLTKCHQQEVEELKNMGKDYQDSNSLKSAEDKLQCVELCLEQAEQRAYASERQVETLKHRVQELECQVQRLNAGLPAPPPPPPPPPPPSFNPIKSFITLISSAKKASTVSALKKEVGDSQQQKAMSEMISAIKKGKVHLRPAPKGSGANYEKAQGKSAVGEMKDMLTSLKKQKLDPIGSPPQSVFPESSSNELLEKLEKWRKISSFRDQPPDSKQSIPKEEESSLFQDLQQALEIESLEGEVSENACSSPGEDFIDILSSPSSHAEEVASAHTSESEDAEYALLRKHPKTAWELGAEFVLENANISRSTFVIDTASRKSPSEMFSATEGNNSVSKIPIDSSLPFSDSCHQGNNRNSTCAEIETDDNKHEILHNVNSLTFVGESHSIDSVDNCVNLDLSTQLRHDVQNVVAPVTSEINANSEIFDEHRSFSEDVISDKVKLRGPIPHTNSSREKAEFNDVTECATGTSKNGISNLNSTSASDC